MGYSLSLHTTAPDWAPEQLSVPDVYIVSHPFLLKQVEKNSKSKRSVQ